MARRVPDTTRARQLLDWSARRTLDQIVHYVLQYTIAELAKTERVEEYSATSPLGDMTPIGALETNVAGTTVGD